MREESSFVIFFFLSLIFDSRNFGIRDDYCIKAIGIIIITVFNLIALPNHNKVGPKRTKKASSIQFGYRKSELMHECFPKHLRREQQE